MATGCAVMRSTTACACRCGRSTPSNSLSVYTPVSQVELAALLANYSVGRLEACEPIEAGIQDTNYFVTTTPGPQLPTLLQSLTGPELPFFLVVMCPLARPDFPA